MTDNKERAAFEKWANDTYYSGLTDIADSWSEKRGMYNDAAHHMAWYAYRAALAASQEKVAPVGYFVKHSGYGPWVEVARTAERAVPFYAAPIAAQADMRECRHCGWMCAPNDAKSKRWYPLAEPVAAQASEPVAFYTMDEMRAYADGFHQARIKAAPQPSAEAVRNSERYLWLRDKANYYLEDAPQVVMTDWAGMPVSTLPSAYPQGAALDAAIDAAMKSAPPQPAEQSDECGEVVVTWDEYRTRILAVTRQDEDGRVLKIIALVPPGPPAEQPSASPAVAEDVPMPAFARTPEGQRVYSRGYIAGRKKGRAECASPADLTDEVRSLLSEARNHIACPAEGHDDVTLALGVIERIDAILASAQGEQA